MSGRRWEEYSLNGNNINQINFVMTKYITLLILLFSLTSCFQNNKKAEEQQFDELMNRLNEKSAEQMQSPLDTGHYFKPAPIIEALIEADTTNRTLREKMRAAYERSQEMSNSECEAILESYQKTLNSGE